MIALVAAACVLLAPPVPFGSTDPAGAWELVWHDEFDGHAIDPSRWTVEDAAISNNKELQYYTPDAAGVREGELVIRAEKRPHAGRQYTAALLDTRASFSMAFGRFECRARIPRGQGMWPAFWMLPRAERWPPEIDIMENLGQQTTRIYTTHHWGPGWPRNQKTGGFFDGPDFADDFHVYSVEWTPDRLDWYIDGVLRFSSTENIPQDPMYLILNLAVGGNWPGSPDATTTFPQEFVIDWVRAFRRTDTPRAHLLLDQVNGDITPDPAQWSFEPGAPVMLHAEPDIGYRFAGWTGDAAGEAPTATISMDGNRRVGARFEPIPGGPRLLSRGRPVRASGDEGAGFEPARAVDASLWSRWSTSAPGERWIEVDMGEPRSIEGVRLAWTFGNDAPMRLEVSDDRASWRTALELPSGTPRHARLRDLRAHGRYVRLVTEPAGSAGTSMFSFDVYGR